MARCNNAQSFEGMFSLLKCLP